jgi:hypothetical protein
MLILLYHFANTQYSELLPVIGANRHSSEDPRAIEKPVVWLTDSPIRAPGVEAQAQFRHEVEIEEDDPCLFKDESAERLKTEWQYISPDRKDSVAKIETLYFYTKPILVKSVRSL